MTDKFTIVNMGLDGSFIKENGKIMEIERVVDLLNKGEHLKQSHEEILRDLEVATFDKELLQKENEQLRKSNKFLSDMGDVIDIVDENKQLKQFIKELTTKGTCRIDLASGYSYNVSAVLTDYRGDVE